MPARVDTLGPFDLEVADVAIEIEIPDGCDEVRFQSRLLSGTWTDAEIVAEWTLLGGNDGNWALLDEPLTLDSANVGVVSGARYLGAMRFLRLRVDVDQSGTPGEVEVVVSQDATGLGALRWRVSTGAES